MARGLVMPRLGEFPAAHPRIGLELSSTDRQVGLVSEGVDCVMRVGVLRDSGMTARPLGRFRTVNHASPAHLAAHGTPTTLDDLDRHQLIHCARTLGSESPGWECFDGTQWRFKPMRGAVTVNNAQSYQGTCIAALGPIQVPATVNPHGLVEVLPACVAEPMPVSLLHAPRTAPGRSACRRGWRGSRVSSRRA